MLKKQSIEIDLSHINDNLKLFIDAGKEDSLEEDFNNDYQTEARYQLREGHFYEYTFSGGEYRNFRLTCSNNKNIVKPRKRKGQEHQGTISPNIYVGTLTLEITNITKPDLKEDLELEVQSIKTDYRTDYQYMLTSITEKCTDLIIQANSPVSHSFEVDDNADSETLYQRFSFVKSIINSEEFEEAIHKIVSTPTTKWIENHELTDVRKIKRFRNKELRQLINATNRFKLPVNHPLIEKGIKYVATKIISNKKRESVDTPENRFIKHALKEFLKFCMDIESHPNANKRLEKEANIVVNKLESHLQESLFLEVSRPITLKLNSPTLQKKEGYRQVLKVWLQFDLAAKLVWKGGEDVYKSGKKDIATLYEYWLFFKLLDVLESIFDIEPKDIEELINNSKDSLDLKLKQGEFTALSGKYTKENRVLNIRFNYNRSFKGENGNQNIEKAGSWTTTLRPDYTLSIWPDGLEEIKNDNGERKAEELEQITHIHFDAKYKVVNIFENGNLDDEKTENREGIYKNADLLKMHAYKDAIRRTGGAYVLYPGGKYKRLEGFHEVLPGLGAFPIKPTKNQEETKHLESFLRDVLSHFLNNASQRENITSKAYKIHKEDLNVIKEPIPEYINGEKLIPDETFVLVGFSKNSKRLKWYKEMGLYNFRMNDEEGSLEFKNDVVNSKFLLIRESGNSEASHIFKIKSGIKVFSKEKLEELGHPEVNKDHYLVYSFDTESIEEFNDVKWSFKDLESYKETVKDKNLRSAAGLPFTTTLTKLMKVKTTKS